MRRSPLAGVVLWLASTGCEEIGPYVHRADGGAPPVGATDAGARRDVAGSPDTAGPGTDAGPDTSTRPEAGRPPVREDRDGDDVLDWADLCPDVPSRGAGDRDGDGLGDPCDPCPDDPSDACHEEVDAGGVVVPDGDGDGVPDAEDVCPATPDPGQGDRDGDGAGDACDPCPDSRQDDRDGDGVCDRADVCPEAPDETQTDSDGDGAGDACDPCPATAGEGDADGDGVCAEVDVCPGEPDPGQEDRDGDGVGDACDPCPDDPDDDADGDGLCAGDDLCPEVADPDRGDGDGDGVGDACDPCPDDPDDDADDDGVCGDRDNCPEIANGGQADGDGDGTGDACDRCDDRVAGDGDGDGVCGEVDNCPELGNGDQADGDGDGRGDACDPCPADPHDDADGDGVCGDLDVCPARADAGQADRDDDGVGDACDSDRDGDGVPDVDDVCPEVADRGQADVDADGVGDACAAVYLFEGFEEGLDRWEVRSGAWGIDAGGTGARRGGGALTDSPGEQWPVAGRIGLLQPLDLSAARQPRLSAWVRYVVGADQQLVLEISAPGVETLALSLLDPARGTENRAHELVHADLAAFAGLPEVRLELRIDAGADLTRGVRIDDLVVAEAPELPVVRLPFSAGFDRGPSPLRLEGDWAWYDAGGTARGVVASTAGPWPAQRSWQRATVLRRLDLSDAARPRLRLLYTGRLSAETTLEVEARTPDDTLVLPVVGPGLHASEPEPLEVALDELAGEPEVRLALRYRLEWFHDALFRIDDLELVDLMDAPPAELPLSEGFEGGLDRWRAQGWTRVEDAARPGRLAMTDSADGTSPLNSTRTLELLPRLDLSQAVRPRLVAWARWRLEAHQQAFSVELLPSDGPVARVDWSDGRPRQEGMARLEADLSAHAGDPALRLRFRLRTERVTSDGVLLDDVRVEEAPAVAPLPVPYHEDFGGALPDWLLECGWSRDASRHRSAPTALHDSPGGTLAAPGTCRAELLRPLDLTDLVEPQLVVWVWWNLHDGGRSGLYLDLWTDDGGPAQTVELAREGESGVFARVEVDLAGLAGRPDVRLRFRTHSPDTQRPVGVAIDDLSVGERPRPEPVVAPWREDFEGPGVEERWEAQGPWGTTDAVHRSWFTAMTDSPQGVSPPFSTTWVRTRRPIDLSGLASPELVFACRHRMGGQHTVWMDVLPAGGGAVETFLHGWYTAHADWHEHRVDLTPYRDGGPVGLRWRMRSEWWRDDGVWVDDVEVREAAGE